MQTECTIRAWGFLGLGCYFYSLRVGRGMGSGQKGGGLDGGKGFCMLFERRLSSPAHHHSSLSLVTPFLSTQICGSPENGRPLFFFSLFLLSISARQAWPSVPVTGAGQWGDWRDGVRLVSSFFVGSWCSDGGEVPRPSAWEHKEGGGSPGLFRELAGWMKGFRLRWGVARDGWNFWAAFDLFGVFFSCYGFGSHGCVGRRLQIVHIRENVHGV